ncbi:MAG: bifunctional DNA-formamidopyrimidine glycosylase/DNA-(apurinic or apyrimidinic site) lyase [Planctomycetes bacterium]|nr:bifunctional DNA-formamidopyrimidine glycosylase/DNA-(apurinic or apyrimidinic site) lyase [Planctomycetota bacterium]
MPELPEVETVRRGAERCLTGQRLDEAELRRPDLRWPIPTDAVLGLRGRRLTAVDRRAKYLLLRFDGRDRPVAIVHLGMSGRLFVDELAPRARPPEWRKHEHWRMQFGRRLLRFVDPRRFGALDVAPEFDLETHPLLVHLGPEPLGGTFDGDALFRTTRKRKTSIKTLIMDARHVVGVGNIYASEACFLAGVRPRRRASTLTRDDCTRLADAIRSVLTAAIEAGGTTLRDYVGVDEETGYFQRELAVYDRAGAPCVRCDTPIKHVVSGQRSTYYCPTCQR